MATVFTPLKHGVLKWDLEDWLKFRHIKWYFEWSPFSKSYYVKCSSETKIKCGFSSVLLHRIVMNADKTFLVDHKFHNTMDCRKGNLRLCTRSQNAMNQRKTRGVSKYKGVYWKKADSKWFSEIKFNQKKYFLGYFKCEEEAALAYNSKAVELFGDFAYLNEIKLG